MDQKDEYIAAAPTGHKVYTTVCMSGMAGTIERLDGFKIAKDPVTTMTYKAGGSALIDCLLKRI
jgi:hypothetical protein